MRYGSPAILAFMMNGMWVEKHLLFLSIRMVPAVCGKICGAIYLTLPKKRSFSRSDALLHGWTLFFLPVDLGFNILILRFTFVFLMPAKGLSTVLFLQLLLICSMSATKM